MSRFTVADASRLVANARSSVHPITYRAPLTGHIDASVSDDHFDLSAPVTAAFDVALEDLRGDDPHTDSEMRRRIDVQRYPLAHASVSGVTSVGDDRYRLACDLTLHGQTRQLEGEADVTLNGAMLNAVGSVTIDIRDFGIKAPRLLMLKVYPEVEIIINLQATRDDSEQTA